MTTGHKNPKFPCKETGRVHRFAFNWIGGGYNDVYATDAEHAIEFAEEAYNVGHQAGKGGVYLKVASDTVRLITNNESYNDSLPLWD